MKRRMYLALVAGALATVALPWPAAGSNHDYVWDGRLAGGYAPLPYVWDGRLAGSFAPAPSVDGGPADSSTARAYVWDGRLAG